MSTAVRLRKIEKPAEQVRFGGYIEHGRFTAWWPDGSSSPENCSDWEPIDGHNRIAEWPTP